MKKLKFFTKCSLVSFLFGAATVWWWVGSGNRIDQVTFERTGSQVIRLWGSEGKIMVTRTVHAPNSSQGFAGRVAFDSIPSAAASEAQKGNPTLLGAPFSFASQPLSAKNGGGMETTIVIPAWLITAVFSLLPLAWFATKLKRKAAKKQAAS